MSEQNNKNIKNQFSGADNNPESEGSAGVLRKIEAGALSVDEGLYLLQEVDSADPRDDVLNKLEIGEIDVQEAIRRIKSENSDPSADVGTNAPDYHPGSTSKGANTLRSWWLILLASGLVGTGLGGWLATLGGGWWLLAAPSLLIGLLVLILSIITYRSPWIHLRINRGRSAPITFGFPMPTRLAAWALRKWGAGIGALDNTAIDELLIAMGGSILGENRILVEVSEDNGSGENIQITIG